MKLKYYLSGNVMKYIIYISLLIIIIFTSIVNAYTLDSSNTVPNKIFKCQPSLVSANFTGTITSVNAWINSSSPVMWYGTFQTNQTSKVMTDNSGGYWTATYGNDNTTLYGNKTITFQVTTASGTFYNTTNNYIFVYSDDCIGTGITNYTQLNRSGLGNYTSRLWSNPNYTLIDLALQPWLDYWGYFFYLFIVGLVATSVYQKSQNVWQPIIVAFTGLSVLATTTAVPDEFRNPLVAILGICFGAIIYGLTGRK